MKPVVRISFPVSAERSLIKAKYTVETCMKEPVCIKTLRLKFHLLSPLIKKPKETEMGIGSRIMGFIFCDLKIQELKFFHWLFVYRSNFYKKSHALCKDYKNPSNFLKIFQTQQITKLLGKNSGQKHSQEVSRILVMETVLMCASHALYRKQWLLLIFCNTHYLRKTNI